MGNIIYRETPDKKILNKYDKYGHPIYKYNKQGEWIRETKYEETKTYTISHFCDSLGIEYSGSLYYDDKHRLVRECYETYSSYYIYKNDKLVEEHYKSLIDDGEDTVIKYMYIGDNLINEYCAVYHASDYNKVIEDSNTLYLYDINNNRVGEICLADNAPVFITNYTYDKHNNITNILTASPYDQHSQDIYNYYDEQDRLIRKATPGRNIVNYEYDKEGRVIKEITRDLTITEA